MRKAETIIIGGGVVGASIAFHLAKRGCSDVLILERESAVGRGSTGKATGGVRAQFDTEIDIRMSLYSLDLLESGEIAAGYVPAGYLFLATSDDHLNFLRDAVEKQRSLGYSEVRLLDREEIRKIASCISLDDVIGGSFGPRDGFLDPLALMNGFLDGAVSAGARIETGSRVDSLIASNGRITGVRTAAGEISCEKAVLCAGAWAREVAATAGIDLPIEPLRRQIACLKVAGSTADRMPMVIDMADGFHFRPVIGAPGEYLVAYPDPDEQPGFATEFDPGFVETVRGLSRKRAPFLADAAVVAERCRAGLYENSPDRHAILGGCEAEGLYLACGFSGHGVMHSPATGIALAEIMLDGSSRTIDVSSLRLDRFARGELITGASYI